MRQPREPFTRGKRTAYTYCDLCRANGDETVFECRSVKAYGAFQARRWVYACERHAAALCKDAQKQHQNSSSDALTATDDRLPVL